ncbi:MAG: hypothetical protein HY042_05080, partial [Spirochaetia bacterium]|nr:hypothetical protein [Spirochaetia bacterium]
MRGYRDPRMNNVCRALAGVGYTAVAPSYADIKNLLVTSETVDEIADSIVRIAGNADLTPMGKMGLFSASFTAGPCLIAAASDQAAHLVSSVCTIGTVGAVDSTVGFLLGHTGDIDDYGTMIMFYNFIRDSIGAQKSRRLEKAFEIATYDNGLRREVPLLPDYLKTLTKQERSIFAGIRDSREVRLSHFAKIRTSRHFKTLEKNLAVDKRVRGMQAAVTLIHGIDDNVVPPSESEHLHKTFGTLGVRSKLTLTPLISHGDASIGPSMIKEIYELATAFAFFFAHI